MFIVCVGSFLSVYEADNSRYPSYRKLRLVLNGTNGVEEFDHLYLYKGVPLLIVYTYLLEFS